MKTISIIGSSIAEHVARELSDAFEIKKHFLSINPFCFVKDMKAPKLQISIPKNKEAYIDDLNKTVFDELKQNKSDYLLIDLLDCRLDINTVNIQDNNYTATASNGLALFLNDTPHSIVSTCKAYDIASETWHEVFLEYYKKLTEIYTPDRIILLKDKSAYTYLSKNGNYYYLIDANYMEQLERLYNSIYAEFENIAQGVRIIPCPEPLFCDEHESRAFTFALSSIYYEYAAKAIKTSIEKGIDYSLVEDCNECSQKLLSTIAGQEPMVKKWKDIQLLSFCGEYKDDFGNVINTNGCKINVIVKGENNSVVIEPGCVFGNATIEIGRNNDIKIGKGNSSSDIFKLRTQDNNIVSIGNDNRYSSGFWVTIRNGNNIVIGNNNIFRGQSTMIGIDSSCYFEIGQKNDIWGSEIHVFDKGLIRIGNNNFFNKQCVLTSHYATKIYIENDSIFASEVQLISGNGHSIFDIELCKKCNDMENHINTIHVHNHVWSGRRCMYLTGAEVGEGSVVGACAVVKKCFPNNCMIAGVPAQIKKKDICWCRDNFARDISSCEPYVNKTKIQ